MKKCISILVWLSMMSFLITSCESITDHEKTLDSHAASSAVELNNTIECINPDDSDYDEKFDDKTVTWGNGKQTKTVEINYYNSLEDFVLKVRSDRGISDILMDGATIKNFNGTIQPDENWHEIMLSLGDEWQAGDLMEFDLEVAGVGPSAFFEVDYELLGECVDSNTYTLTLAVYPEGAGTVTGGGQYLEGELVPLTATANIGYLFVNWTDEGDVEISDEALFGYTMPAMAKTLTANFEEVVSSFVCGISTIMDTEGNIYNTVLIGNQCWMKENLKYLPSVMNPANGSFTEPYYYVYGYGGTNVTDAKATANYQNYGVLYNWPAALISCPAGWHLPSDDAWTRLANQLGGESFAGGLMKSTRTAPDEHPRWNSPNTGATDLSGFTAFPGGFRQTIGGGVYLGEFGLWWSADIGEGFSLPWYRNIKNDFASIQRENHQNKNVGMSVRCLRD